MVHDSFPTLLSAAPNTIRQAHSEAFALHQEHECHCELQKCGLDRSLSSSFFIGGSVGSIAPHLPPMGAMAESSGIGTTHHRAAPAHCR
jgi:hypothetical protein